MKNKYLHSIPFRMFRSQKEVLDEMMNDESYNESYFVHL